jgi:hypothetical protein
MFVRSWVQFPALQTNTYKYVNRHKSHVQGMRAKKRARELKFNIFVL